MPNKQLEDEVKQLRGFVKAIFDRDCPFDISGDELQEMAIEHGLLEMYTPREPCGDKCACSELNTPSAFKDGDVFCFRLIESIQSA